MKKIAKKIVMVGVGIMAILWIFPGVVKKWSEITSTPPTQPASGDPTGTAGMENVNHDAPHQETYTIEPGKKPVEVDVSRMISLNFIFDTTYDHTFVAIKDGEEVGTGKYISKNKEYLIVLPDGKTELWTEESPTFKEVNTVLISSDADVPVRVHLKGRKL
jgi:hypothetical protein